MVLDRKDALRQRLHRVAITDRNRFLQNDRSGIELRGDEMDGRAGKYAAPCAGPGAEPVPGKAGNSEGWILRTTSGNT